MSFFDFFRRSSLEDSGRAKLSTLQFEGHEVVVVRRAHRRTMTIHMRPHQPLKVTTALKVTDAEVLRFLASKQKWIAKNLAQFEKIPKPLLRTGAEGEKWMFKGREIQVYDALTVLKNPFVVWGDESVTIYWPQAQWLLRGERREKALALLESSLRKEAENLILSRLRYFSEQMRLKPRRVRFMQAKTRWGSCSSRGNLNFNWRLIGAPPGVIDSIVVHELAHLEHLNHSDDFWALVAKFAPLHQKADQWLKTFQHLL